MGGTVLGWAWREWSGVGFRDSRDRSVSAFGGRRWCYDVWWAGGGDKVLESVSVC